MRRRLHVSGRHLQPAGRADRPNPCFDDDSAPIDGTSCIAVAIGSNEGECPGA